MPDLLLTTIPKANIPAAVAYEDEANVFTAQQTITKASEASTSEILAHFAVSDDSTSYLRIKNDITTDAHFSPTIHAYYSAAANTKPGLHITGRILGSQDTGTVAGLILSTATGGGAALTTRPVLDVQNATTSVFKIEPDGLITAKTIKESDTLKTSNYTALTTDHTIRVDASGADRTITLPAASGNAGLIYKIIRVDVANSINDVFIEGDGSELIDGNLRYILSTAESVILECDGTAWVCITKPQPSALGYYYRKGITRRYVAGVDGSNNALQTSTTAPTVNTLYALPFIVSRTTVFDTIECEVTTLGSGSSLRMGIYRERGDGFPGSLIFDSGSISAATTGVKTATITDQTFQPAMYFLAWECSATAPQIRILPGAGGCMAFGGYTTPFSTTLPQYGYQVPHTFGTLPGTYSGAASFQTTASAPATPIPAIALRPI